MKDFLLDRVVPMLVILMAAILVLVAIIGVPWIIYNVGYERGSWNAYDRLTAPEREEQRRKDELRMKRERHNLSGIPGS